MNNNKLQKNRGFTLVEVMVAVFVLTISVSSLMTLLSSSLFAAKYARNEITANYLSQEVIDYIRNERDTIVFLNNPDSNQGWNNFVSKYQMCSDEVDNCYIDVNKDIGPTKCPANECFLYFDERAEKNVFYNYDNIGQITNFERKLIFSQNLSNLDEINVEVIVYWKNGGIPKSKSLKTSLMKWQ